MAALMPKIFRHGIVGGSASLVFFFLVIAGVELMGLRPICVIACSYLLLLFISFLFTKTWVFESDAPLNLSLVKYVLVSVSGFVLNLSFSYFFVDILGVWYVFVLLITASVIPLLTFILHYFWTFK